MKMPFLKKKITRSHVSSNCHCSHRYLLIEHIQELNVFVLASLFTNSNGIVFDLYPDGFIDSYLLQPDY